MENQPKDGARIRRGSPIDLYRTAPHVQTATYTIREVATILGVSPEHIRNLARKGPFCNGRITPIKIGERRTVFSKDEVDRFVADPAGTP